MTMTFKNATFIKKHLWTSEGNLLHNFKNGKSTINGYLEDYCYVIQSFIALHEVTFEQKWLDDAKQLTDYCLEHFYDTNKSFFAFTSKLDEPLINQHFETEDNVIPASNSVMSNNLLQLSCYFENEFYKKIAIEMLEKIIPNIDYPSAFSNWLIVYLNCADQNTTLAIVGEKAIEFVTKINALYCPNLILAGSKNESNLPFLKDRFETGKTMIYKCQNKSCALPTANFDLILADLKK